MTGSRKRVPAFAPWCAPHRQRAWLAERHHAVRRALRHFSRLALDDALASRPPAVAYCPYFPCGCGECAASDDDAEVWHGGDDDRLLECNAPSMRTLADAWSSPRGDRRATPRDDDPELSLRRCMAK